MRIFDYIKGYEKRRYKKSQIYIGKKKEAPSNIQRSFNTTTMWTEREQPKKIFIAGSLKAMDIKDPINIKYVAESVGHEELHNYLQKERGSKASTGLDNIVPGAINLEHMSGKRKGTTTHYGPNEMVLGPTTTRIVRKRIKNLPYKTKGKIDYDYIFK